MRYHTKSCWLFGISVCPVETGATWDTRVLSALHCVTRFRQQGWLKTWWREQFLIMRKLASELGSTALQIAYSAGAYRICTGLCLPANKNWKYVALISLTSPLVRSNEMFCRSLTYLHQQRRQIRPFWVFISSFERESAEVPLQNSNRWRPVVKGTGYGAYG